MDFDELLDILEIDSIEDFTFFENYAALVEFEEPIPYDLFYKVLADIPSDTLVELTDDYFEDILQAMPDENADVFTLMATIKQALLGLAKSTNTREERIMYVDELFKFRNWYIFDTEVHCKRVGANIKKTVTVFEAMAMHRLQKFNQEEYKYDFSDCLDYDIDEYSISIDAEIAEEYEDIIEEDEDLYDNSLIDKDFPVIDGEDLETEIERLEDYNDDDDDYQ